MFWNIHGIIYNGDQNFVKQIMVANIVFFIQNPMTTVVISFSQFLRIRSWGKILAKKVKDTFFPFMI